MRHFNLVRVFAATCIIFCSLTYSHAQKKIPASSTQDVRLEDFLNGVRYAYLICPFETEEECTSHSVFLGVFDFLTGMGFEMVGLPSSFSSINPSSYCEIAYIETNFDVDNMDITNIIVRFYSCTAEWWEVEIPTEIWHSGFGDVRAKVFRKLKKEWPYRKPAYNVEKRFSLPSLAETGWSEVKLRAETKNPSSAPFMGVYQNLTGSSANYRIGCFPTDSGYKFFYISGAEFADDWKEGELKAELTKTADPTTFLANWTTSDKLAYETPHIVFDSTGFVVNWSEKEPDKYIKVFPVD